MDIGSLAFTIAKCVVPCISNQVGHTLSYSKNLEKLEDEVEKLVGTEAICQQSIAEAERKGEKIFVIVQNWMKKANVTITEAKKLIDIEGQAEAGCCMGQFLNLWTRNQLSKRFEEMTREISEVLGNGKFNRISYRVVSEVTTASFCRGYEALDSTTTMLDEIKEALMDPKIHMIGMHGMGGVGKTTLINELAWKVKTEGLIDVVAIATITRSPDVEKIQDQIAEMLGLKFENTTRVGRARELGQRIRQEKSVLVILDDIWSDFELIVVGIPFGAEHDGCKVVVTSRDHNVLIKMGTQKDFNLKALLEKDSWNLFQKMAGDVVKEFNIKPIAQKVAKCCAGLPLLIVTVAKGLRKKDVTTWSNALIQLERFDHEDLQKKVYPTLELSYDCLENEELKLLFLLIGSFGLNEVHTGELLLCIWGLGFYSHMHTLTNARKRHYKLINDLRASSLLLDGELEYVRLHDMVRDMAKSIANKFYPSYSVPKFTRMKVWPKVDQLQNCHHIIIPWSYIDELPEKLECPNLQLLILENIGDSHLNVSDNFFSEMKEVRTLSFYGMSFTPSLPSLYHLINLRTLNLYGCKLGDIRMVAELTNLEILYLEKSSIQELPIEIGHLTHLQLLCLANCSELRIIPKNLLSSLTCLEELYLGNCYIEWGVEGSKSESDNATLGELGHLHKLATLDLSIQDTSVLPRDLQFLEKLERYNILIGGMWKWSLKWSSAAHESSRTLKLIDSLWTNISLTTVEDLSFAKLKGVKDVLYELNDEGFPQLKHLHIEDSDELLHIINSRELVNPHSAFSNLNTLVLRSLNNMKEICHGLLPTHSFEKLEVIKVEDCNKLKNLFLYCLTRNLSQLHELEILSCNDMIEIIKMEQHEEDGELLMIALPELRSLTLKGLPMLLSFSLPLKLDKGNPSIQSIPPALLNQQVVMPKLETLVLSGINSCKIWDDKHVVHSCIQNLTHLTLIGCKRLTTLFSSLLTRELVKLQHLVISDCSTLQEIFIQEERVQFPNMETLDIRDMYDLRSIWPNQVAMDSFCKLIKINISLCGSLDYVFPISVAKELRQLQDLTINGCAIENIIDKNDSCCITPEKLTIHHCHNMKTIVPYSVLFQYLDKLDVSCCDAVVNIITPSTTTRLPKLRILSISGCDKLEEIYGSNDVGDEPSSEIVFMKLEELTLKKLPRLTSFCHGSYTFKFRSLKMVRLIECPLMEIFCNGSIITPSHTKVQYGSRQEDHWDGDLNTTIRTIFIEKNSRQDLSSSTPPKSE